MKTVGIVGLGLIGGSFAKAYKTFGEDWSVLAHDIDGSMLALAQIDKDIDGMLTKKNLKTCDLIILALYPTATIDYIKENAPYIQKNAIVIDCCGTKRTVCEELFKVAREFGFLFVGGHPMAGRHFSGYKYSRATLFKDASMIIVPEKMDDSAVDVIAKIVELLEPARFGNITTASAKRHDQMIAFTSQLAHIVSNAYIKSPTALEHRDFSAGSFKDLTRVAWLNEMMWSELFLENKDYLLSELSFLMNSLEEYKKAIENDDAQTLQGLLRDGKEQKKESDRLSRRHKAD